MTTVLITGADGYIGRLLIGRYLDHADTTILAGVHATSISELANKTTRLRSLFHSELVIPVPLDVRAVDPCFAIAGHRDQISQIVHAAATTRFDVAWHDAAAVNVAGTSALARFARECPRLDSFCHVSTVYATGLQEGNLREGRSDGAAGFANHYEWSKWAAEELLQRRFPGLPLRIARLATVIAHSNHGDVAQYNVLHQTLRLLFHGLLPIVPGTADVPLYFVTGVEAARSILALTESATASGTYHLSNAADEAVSLGELLDIAFQEFSAADEFRRKRILPPLLADWPTFELLRDGLEATGGTMVTNALQAMAPFARQLYIDKRVSTDRMRQVLPQPQGDMRATVRATCRSLVASRWGRRDAA